MGKITNKAITAPITIEKMEKKDHKNARSSHNESYPQSGKKISLFGTRTTRQNTNNQLIQESLDAVPYYPPHRW